jgi:hypothetical protein
MISSGSVEARAVYDVRGTAQSEVTARCKTVGAPISGANLGAIGLHDLRLSWTDMNGRIVRDLHGELA